MSETSGARTRTAREEYPFLRPAEQADELGRLGPYRVLAVLSSGGMGIVFRAEDVRLRRLVALKVLKPALAEDPATRKRFLREARLAGALRHDHVVTAHEVGEDRGIPFLAMQLLRGESLEDRLRRDGRLPVPEVLRLGREAAEGLAAAHEHGLIHRDVKPSNLWLEDRGDGRPVATESRIKILDFGMARTADGDTRLTDLDALIGTPGYAAPEQADGETTDPRSDLFSLGCVLYRACTGVLPFRGEGAMAVLLAMAEDEPRPPHELNAEVPPRLSELILSLLAREPAGRPPSAAAVAEALAEILAGQPAARPGGAGAARAARRPWRRRLALAAVVVLALASAGGAFAIRPWLADARRPAPAPAPEESWQVWQERGREHARQKRWAEAVSAYDEAVKRKADEANLWHERGRADLALERWDDAVRDGGEAIRLDPKDPAGYDVRAEAYARLGQHDKGIADLSEMVRLQPGSAQARGRRARAYVALQDHGSAVADLTEAIRLDATNADFPAARAREYLQFKDWERAVTDCTEALRLDPKRADCLRDRGWALHQQSDFTRALADLDESLRLDPNSVEGHSRRAHVYFVHLNQADRAVADYDELIRLDPKRAGWYVERGGPCTGRGTSRRPPPT
jgi:tetratricopeptide (TPR) repeat protein